MVGAIVNNRSMVCTLLEFECYELTFWKAEHYVRHGFQNSHRCVSLSSLIVQPSQGNLAMWRTSAEVWTPHERGAADCR
jgi:hypothetical protein